MPRSSFPVLPKSVSTTGDRSRLFWALGLLAAATIVAYHNSFSGPFLFDDLPSIPDNASLRSWSPWWTPLLPEASTGYTVDGRPVLNLSLAINYALGGLSVTSYHVVNLFIHLAAALVLFDLVRLTLLTPRLRDRFSGTAVPIAFVSALLWAVHPLHTESVTYVIQRAESMMSLFYLLTLYCFRCGNFETRSPGWLWLGAVFCLLGMATKELMVSAPVLVLLYDRAFVSGSFAHALKKNWRWYVALSATYVLLVILVIRTGNRGGTAGLNINVTWWKYGLTELISISHYLWLSVWPHPLVFDYGTEWDWSWAQLVPSAVLILTLVTTTIFGFWKNTPWSVPALLFFAILAPTSSILPGNRQTSAEHRMYLPLASVTALAVIGVARVAAKFRGLSPVSRSQRLASGCVIAGIAGAFSWLTIERNADYRSETALYADTVLKKPRNHFAQYNLAKNLAESGHAVESIAHYEAALQLQPGISHVHNNFGNALIDAGRFDEGIAQFREAVRLDRNYANAYYNLGIALVRSGKKAEAVEPFTTTVRLRPDYFEALDNLGSVLFDLGRLPEAATNYEAALRLNSRDPATHVNLGNLRLMQGQRAVAIEQFQQALQLDPSFVPAQQGLARAKGYDPSATRR